MKIMSSNNLTRSQVNFDNYLYKSTQYLFKIYKYFETPQIGKTKDLYILSRIKL